MEFTIEREFKANVLFEFSVAIDGWTYLVIYGKHINGYFCALPSWSMGCEMSSPDAVDYNTKKLISCGMADNVAPALANAIKYMGEQKSL